MELIKKIVFLINIGEFPPNLDNYILLLRNREARGKEAESEFKGNRGKEK